MPLIGICGKPSTGKSTFFSAATLIDVPISARPFTTVVPNKGIAFVRAKCPCIELGTKCNPLNSRCENGTRYIPINFVDLAGLVPGAHAGKGLGNRFLDEIRQADALIQIIDVSGRTDEMGNPCRFHDPANEIIFLEEEITLWIAGIIHRAWSRIKGRDLSVLAATLSGLKITEEQIADAAARLGLPPERINWSEDDVKAFANEVRKIALPTIIAANKIDIPGARENFEQLKSKFPHKMIIPTYADGELALRRAEQKGLIKYSIGAEDFEILSGNAEQIAALEKIKKILKENHGTRVQEVLETATFKLLKLIVVYPVSDENKYTDHFDNVLPDAVLIKEGSTAMELAAHIHTDLAKNFIFAIDAKNKMRVGRDYKLKDGDIVRIVAGKRK